MRVCRHGLVAVIVASLTVSTAFAEARHVVDPSALAGAVREHADRIDADRAVVRATLARPEVQALAAAAGLDLVRLPTAVDTLSPADAAKAASAARAVDLSIAQADVAALVGGASTVTISTTTIIIGLLVLILIIVAVD
jgi:hypothetical protein